MNLAIDLVGKSDNLISMSPKIMTATEVARNFSAVIKEVSTGEEVDIVKGNVVIARILPPAGFQPNGAALLKSLTKLLKDNAEIMAEKSTDWEELEAFDSQVDQTEDADAKYDRIMKERAEDEQNRS